MMDILETIAIELPCAACGGRDLVTLKEVLLSKHLIHDGCPVPSSFSTECPPLYHADLIAHGLIHDLERTWLRLVESANGAGGELVLLGDKSKGELANRQ
ncbi:MAG: hypothetical protein KGJ80_14830 [Chloroflexota bacterium]|nr:hypothetical protein [Chloroflexota bacterium]